MGISAHLEFGREGFRLDAGFDAPKTGVTALFGPSGSGKTTLLRCIAGLERAKGNLEVNGVLWQDEKIFLPTHRRELGYVFQEASLFPHLSVKENLEYGYRRTQDKRIKFGQAVEWLGLSRLVDRKDVASLSGGERQRVAIGRALLSSPRILLMDEPMAALDMRSRQEILPCLERLHRELEIPVLYVSHALDEVARLADHLVLLEEGRVIASGTLSEMLTRLDLPTAHLDDAGAVIEAAVSHHDDAYALTRLDFSGGSLWVGRVDQPEGAKLRARILARDVSIALEPPKATSIANILEARIIEILDEGSDKVNVRMDAGQQLLSRITRRSRDLLGLKPGMTVYAQVKSVALAM